MSTFVNPRADKEKRCARSYASKCSQRPVDAPTMPKDYMGMLLMKTFSFRFKNSIKLQTYFTNNKPKR